jgi:hypothetical protein
LRFRCWIISAQNCSVTCWVETARDRLGLIWEPDRNVRRSDIHYSGFPGVFDCLVLFLKRAAENQVNGSLRVGGGMNDEAVTLKR